MNLKYDVDELINFIRQTLISQFIPEDDAEIISQRMIDADLRGMHGHGVFRLPPYMRRIHEGGYNINPNIKNLHDTPVSALVDGDNGFGQLVMTHAADLAIKKAKESGLAWIGLQNSNHAGAAGVYVAMTLSHDLIGIYMAVANANHMPPWGGTDMLLSTNPIAFSIPAGEEDPILLDIATTETSYGKVKVYADMDKKMPVGWMLNKDGTPLTDPKKASEGFLLPIGGHKGYGLNLIVGMMAGVMNQANFGSNVIDFNADFASPTNTGQAFFAIKPDLFQSLESFKKETDIRIREIKNSTPMDPSNPVQIPGHMAVQREKEMKKNGVPVSEKTIQLLSELEKKYNTKVEFNLKGR